MKRLSLFCVRCIFMEPFGAVVLKNIEFEKVSKKLKAFLKTRNRVFCKKLCKLIKSVRNFANKGYKLERLRLPRNLNFGFQRQRI